MLHILVGDAPSAVYATSIYFNNCYADEWLEDPLVKEIIKDIDGDEVLSSQCIQSPFLGQISPAKLSGGTKTLILILKDRSHIFNASQCGDNCAKWLLRMVEQDEITINLRHFMNFGNSEFKIHILNTGSTVYNMVELTTAVHDLLQPQ